MRSSRSSTPAARRFTRTTTTVAALASVATLGTATPSGATVGTAAAPSTRVHQASAPTAAQPSPLRYRWTQHLRDLDTYSVAFVRGWSPGKVLRAIGPVRRRAADQDVFGAMALAAHLAGDSYDLPAVAQVYRARGGTVVFCGACFRAAERVARLSRGGVAAGFSSTVNLDTWVTIGRHGRVVRDFDPYDYTATDKSHALPQEAGLPFGTDLDTAASWTLLQRVTGVHVSRRAVLRAAHPTYVLRGRN